MEQFQKVKESKRTNKKTWSCQRNKHTKGNCNEKMGVPRVPKKKWDEGKKFQK